MVEDAISGIKAAHAGGMDAACVPTTFTKEQLAQVEPEYYLDHIRDLTQLKELL